MKSRGAYRPNTGRNSGPNAPPGRARDAVPLDQALGGSAPLARLSARLRESSARYADVRDLLPALLAAEVSAGPVDESGWTLLTTNAAVAAKLRQLKPHIEARLAARGWSAAEVRIKVLPGG